MAVIEEDLSREGDEETNNESQQQQQLKKDKKKNKTPKKKKRDESDEGDELRAEIEEEEKIKKTTKVNSGIGIMSDQSFSSLPLSEHTMNGINDIGFSNMT